MTSVPDQTALRNLLLKRLAPADFALLAPHLERLPLHKGEMLYGRGTVVRHVWFPETGLGSLVAVSPEGHRIEAGLFGRDGFTPTSVMHGSDQPAYDCVVQMPGGGHRMTVAALCEAADRSADLRRVLLRYAETLALQASYTALSNAVHQIDERLARWLLMCHDRHDSDELPLTHEFLSIMLAVRRPSVTTALHVLEGNGFIHAERGWITIRDRDALEDFAGDAYGVPEAEYRRLLGPLG